jgi:hypothetical protein
VRTKDSGINKPFDRILKAFADEAPRLFLRLLGLPSDVDIQPMRTETAPPMAMPDYVATLRRGGKEVIFHAEFEARYHSGIPLDMARYGLSLVWQHHLPVESVLVLLRPEGTPAKVPEVGCYKIGGTETRHRYRVVRCWEMDPTPVLDTGDPRLLSWALLMKSTGEQVRRIGALVGSGGDEEALARFLILGDVRYDRSALQEMLGGGKMSGFDKAYLEASNTAREIRAKAWAEGAAVGKAEGIVEGQTKGKVNEARHVLRIGLRAKFPKLEQLPEIDRISSAEQLEALVENVFRSNDERSVHAAIMAAAAKLN